MKIAGDYIVQYVRKDVWIPAKTKPPAGKKVIGRYEGGFYDIVKWSAQHQHWFDQGDHPVLPIKEWLPLPL